MEWTENKTVPNPKVGYMSPVPGDLHPRIIGSSRCPNLVLFFRVTWENLVDTEIALSTGNHAMTSVTELCGS